VPALAPFSEKFAVADPLVTVPDVTVPTTTEPFLMVKVTVPELTVAGATVAVNDTEVSPYTAVFEEVEVVVAVVFGVRAKFCEPAFDAILTLDVTNA
jgi:hypothetical protein